MSTEQKPWGTTTPIYTSAFCHIDQISVVKGGFSSRHLHREKKNVFIVHIGSIAVTLFCDKLDEVGNRIVVGRDSDPLVVRAGVIHKFECKIQAIVTEIYTMDAGSMVAPIDRNDIVRFSTNGVRK